MSNAIHWNGQHYYPYIYAVTVWNSQCYHRTSEHQHFFFMCEHKQQYIPLYVLYHWGHFSLLAIEHPSNFGFCVWELHWQFGDSMLDAMFFSRNRVIHTRLFVGITNYIPIDILRRNIIFMTWTIWRMIQMYLLVLSSFQPQREWMSTHILSLSLWCCCFDQLLCGPLKFIPTSNGLSVFIQFLSVSFFSLCFKCKSTAIHSLHFSVSISWILAFISMRLKIYREVFKCDIYDVEHEQKEEYDLFYLCGLWLLCLCIFPGAIFFILPFDDDHIQAFLFVIHFFHSTNVLWA